ncbi:IgGFc-binding protein-like protein [Lates japonicus]|uniref:IgGFc-binding protein-like protein n=1 Tax=Lates japonicus TaxID=270547 RepID=A0AAD3NMA0_LATJO|nr:IgGFc-binding protein-like protein [Lates japonicus]
MIVTSPDLFGRAWKVPGNYTCSDGCGSSCPQCTNEQPARAQCEVIQAADGPLSFCHEEVDPAPYFSDCVFDVCVSGNQGHDLLCRATEAYVSACQSANVRIYPWRQNTTCRLDCPANSHYELCGTDCGHTCASSIDATCEQVCSEGCFCDDGFLRSGTTCVPVESCGCLYDGSYYNAGESFWTESCSQRCECRAPNDLRCSAASCTPTQECTIRNGQLGCYDAMSTCTVWGDPHYITFDGAVAHFQGTCTYIITESGSHGTNETQFRVAATNNHRGNNRVSFVSAVDIYLSNQLESEYIRIGPNRRVKVNGSEISLPATVGTLGQVVRQGSYIVVDASDLVVQFDGRSTLLVRIGQNRQNRVTGMCGNSNRNPADDKVLPNGTLAQNDNEFGHSWKAPTSQPGCGSTDDRSGGGLSDCTFREEYTELCSVITNTTGPFSACHLTGTMSVSRCQLFEAGFHSSALHLRDDSCTGTLHDGRLVFHFNNDDQLCGTVLRSNGTHFIYENTIQGDVDPHGGLISRQRNIHLRFCCEYPLTQALSMAVGINPVESIVRKKLPSGHGQYHMRMIPYQDAGFHFPLTSHNNIEMEIDQRLYVEVRTEGVDGRQLSTILDSCWATPVNYATYPVRWDLINAECPNPADGTVELVQNGVSTVARFSFRMFTFTNFTSIYLHCQRFPMHGPRDFIAPFWTDLDNRGNGHVYYNQYTTGSVLQQATQDINAYFPGLNFNANWVFVATWYEVAYYPNSGTAGYDTINSAHHYTIPGSFSSTATGPNSNFRLGSNVNVPGRWAFRTDHGSRGCTFNGEPVQLGDSFWSDNTCTQKCTCTSLGMQCVRQPCSFSQICQPSAFQFSCQTVRRGTCTISGDPHYYTFDNTVFHFQGTCTYVLSEQCDGGLSYYRVEGKNEHRGSTHVSWTRLVKVFVHNETIELVKGQRGKAKVNGIFAATPFDLNNGTVQVYETGSSVVISTDFGLELDPDFTIQLSIQPKSKSTTAAFTASSFVTFGVTAGPPHFVRSHCTGIYNGSLGGLVCWPMVDPQEQVDACVEIIRVSRDPRSALCEVLRDYALMCQQKGVALGHWRNTTGCVQTCPQNSHYELCGTTCPSTCPSLSFPFTCDTVCQEGCQCDDGLTLNGNQCVPPTSCGCHHQGQYHQSGEQFWDGEECQSLCTCNGTTGTVHCTPNSCGPQESCRVVGGELGCHPNPHGTCSSSGDPHYITFDRKAYDFQGTCRYVLATVCNDTDGFHQFSVEAKNEPWNGLSLSLAAEVFVNVWGYQVHLSRERRGVVQVNGVTRNLPILLDGGHVSIYASGSRVFVSTDFGLSVTFDGYSTVFISVPGNYSGKTCGLCGNFNGNPNDEFQTPSGTIVTSPDAFGTAWKVPGNYTCSDGCGSSCPQCTNEQPARAQCEVIQAADGPLSFCHEEVDPTPYFNDCVFDVCVSGNQGQDLLCRAIETYVSACQSANVRIYPWRQNTTCRVDCPANSHYELCGTDCGHTCASSIVAACEQVCSEGCFCDEGFHRSGTRCVPVESCGCLYDGFYYDAGESFWTEGCSQKCECHAPNDLRCSAASCTPAQECTIRNGQLGCFDAMSTCTVWGDPHYITFDGAVAHFQGTCSYIITESVSHSTNETRFWVAATNNHRGNNRVSFVSAVDIYLSNQLESEYIRIGPNRRVKVNGSEISLPATVGTLGQVVRQGSYIVVDASDLVVQFDGRSTLLVRIDQNRQNRVTGMCGNSNRNPADDKVLPSGTLAQNDNEFGHSWKAPTSQPGCGSTDDRSGGGLSDCTFREEYTELCSVITNTTGPFTACHLHSDPQPFFSSCVYDLCLYTPANGMLCSAISAYERTCSVLGLDIPEWRSGSQCAESDPCEHLNCTEYEWCGEKDGVYGCFCDEYYSRQNNESYNSYITCASSSGTISLSRCQLFEAGFHPNALHLRDNSCRGTLQDGRLVFHFNNDDQLCGTVLRSNGTHFRYENAILGNESLNTHLVFSCEYPLTQALSMDVGINPIESFVKKRLPSGQGRYHLRMIPYQDAGFLLPLTSNKNMEMDVDQRLYVEVRAEGVDGRQISTILDSCWATPVKTSSYPIRLDLITTKCPDPADDTVELVQNGNSTAARFSFSIFTFTNFPSIYLHCQVHLCLLRHNNCIAHCNQDHNRVQRDASYHDTVMLSLGPLAPMQGKWFIAPNSHP